MRESEKPRIHSLDGLRCVAILAVLLYHYFSRWTPPRHYETLYPYGSVFAPFFRYGFYGVELFFVVSGFVITLTLYRCATPAEFAVRRLARLWPPMALCCLITLCLVRLIPNHTFYAPATGLLPSLTFMDPHLLNLAFKTHLEWIDDAYWSLFVEVRFYALAACVFFLGRDRFLRMIYHAARIVLALSLLCALLHWESVNRILELLFVSKHLPWFLMGIGFFFFLERSSRDALTLAVLGVAIISLLARAALDRSSDFALAATVIPVIFAASFRVPVAARLLSCRIVAGLGVASYSLYLLHQNLGTAIIGWLGKVTGLAGPKSAVLAVVTAILVAAVARVVYVLWEAPSNRFIVNWYTGRVRRTAALKRNCAESEREADGVSRSIGSSSTAT